MNDRGPGDSDASEELDMSVPSTKLVHDFVPNGEVTPSSTGGGADDAGMQLCPGCGTNVESWQLTCHSCGAELANRQAPLAVREPSSKEQVTASFRDWLSQGTALYDVGQFNEAQICFNEALSRVKGLKNSRELEAEVRKKLAKALQKQDKRAEAAEQYLALSKLLGSSESKYQARARELAQSTVDVLSKIGSGAAYRSPTRRESKLVPLYCASCKQLLADAEVYGFRNGKTSFVRCFCGSEAPPLARFDAKHLRALKDEPTLHLVRAQMLEAASDNATGSRNRNTAIAVCLLLGWCGGQAIYLGEYFYGAFYAIWFLASWLLVFLHRASGFDIAGCVLSFVPWVAAIFQAVRLSRMSRVSFNLTYNIEEVVSRLPADKAREQVAETVFSMEPGEEPADPDEGFEDEMTASSVKLKTVRRNDSLLPE